MKSEEELREYYRNYQRKRRQDPKAREIDRRQRQKYRQNHPESDKLYQRQHPEKCRKNADTWRKRYPERSLFSNAKKRAKLKGIDFTLKQEDIIIPEFCPILGIKLESCSKNRDNWPSVDRIDNLKGYVPDNICVISNKANSLKSNGTAEEHRKIAKYIESFT